MNIKDARAEIENTVKAYLLKDEFGRYRIETSQQRPIFLLGAPGIGKTAIMEQISKDMKIGLVSYSMTHHTRQSAIGLPYITQKQYDGKTYSVSEYTMSEIIASVYDYIELSKISEGILFLDEINCVSESLAPAMLQFLQFKTFGGHAVPEGWIVVTAGNPPEYNKSVREMDIATLDRVKKIEVEPDYEVWKEYACQKNVHASVMTYLDAKRADFYRVETTVDGKAFVTARGWEDLSCIIKLYEQMGVRPSQSLISQYIQHPIISKDFAIYYELFNKYKADYKVKDILEGNVEEYIKQRASKAPFDERLTLVGLIIDALTESMLSVINEEDFVSYLTDVINQNKGDIISDGTKAIEICINREKEYIKNTKLKGILKSDDEYKHLKAISELENYKTAISHNNQSLFETVKKLFDEKVELMEQNIDKVVDMADNLFTFAEEVFEYGQEMLIIVTELTANKISAEFISRYGCDKYFKHNDELLFYERGNDIMKDIAILEDN